MQYKALIFDLDGTAVVSKLEAQATNRVVEAVRKAHKKVIVTCATGRTFTDAEHIVKQLGIVCPGIFFGGSQIFDPITKMAIWKIEIPKKSVAQIFKICKSYPSQVFLTNDPRQYSYVDDFIAKDESIVYLKEIQTDLVPKLISKLQKIDDIAAHSTSSWNPQCLDVHITHKTASKKHALTELLRMLKVETNDVIAVGDNGNDIPLFESAGLKIAVGNATEELKQKADYITKSVEDDGLAFAIEKFILS